MDSWTIKELKAYIEKQGGSHVDCVEKSDLLARAKSLATPGAAATSATTEVKQTSAKVAPAPHIPSDYGFLHKWRRGWASHENKYRVETWMAFHGSIRSQLTAMGEILNDAVRLSAWTLNGSDLGDEALNFLDQFGTTFKVFATRIAEHAEYEDQCLFSFFTDLLPDFKALGVALTAQHQEMDAMEIDIMDNSSSLRKALVAVNSDEVKRLSPLLLSQYSEYQQLIIEHLASEENSLIGPWLHLSDEQYQEYNDKYLKPHGHSPSSIPIVGSLASEENGEQGQTEQRQREKETRDKLKKEEEKKKQEEQAKKETQRQVDEERKREEQRREQRKQERQEREREKPKDPPLPKLYDRHGREVDLKRPGCCFDGVDGCCKGSAYQRLLQKNGYVLDPNTGTYVLRK